MADVHTTLKKFLKDRGIKQTWLAKEAEITPEALNRIVNGRFYPTLPVAHRIVRALRRAGHVDVTTQELWPLPEEDE